MLFVLKYSKNSTSSEWYHADPSYGVFEMGESWWDADISLESLTIFIQRSVRILSLFCVGSTVLDTVCVKPHHLMNLCLL